MERTPCVWREQQRHAALSFDSYSLQNEDENKMKAKNLLKIYFNT
jgi:hypothetical protein